MDVPVFSVIVPAYNAAAFLRRCVDSVLGQSFSDLELLLVDDGSVDDTLLLCREYADRDARVRVFHQENRGHTGARNAGLREAVGRYVVFLDSDDWLEADFLQHCSMEILTCQPDILVSGLCRHGENGITRMPCGAEPGVYDSCRFVDRLLMAEDGSFLFPKSLSGKAFRKSAVEPFQLAVPSEVRIGEDGACFVATAMASARICVLEGVGYHFTVSPESVSHHADPNALFRCGKLLRYYREQLDLTRETVRAQHERNTVAQLYTALLYEARAGCGPEKLRQDLRAVLADPDTDAALRAARFGRNGTKMKIKQLILRYRLLWLIKLLM